MEILSVIVGLFVLGSIIAAVSWMIYQVIIDVIDLMMGDE